MVLFCRQCHFMRWPLKWHLNILWPETKLPLLANDVLKRIFLTENVWLVNKIVLKFVIKIQLTTGYHWFRQWLGAQKATSHYLNQWCPSLPTHASLSLNVKIVTLRRLLQIDTVFLNAFFSWSDKSVRNIFFISNPPGHHIPIHFKTHPMCPTPNGIIKPTLSQ